MSSRRTHIPSDVARNLLASSIAVAWLGFVGSVVLHETNQQKRAASTTQQSAQQPAVNAEATNQDQPTDQQSPHWYSFLAAQATVGWILAILTGLTLNAIRWQAQETARAADSARDSTELAREALHSTERAQVGVPYTDWKVILPDEQSFGDFSFSIGYKVTNAGRTHAVISHVASFGTWLNPGDLPFPMKFSDKDSEWEGEAIIAAGQTIPQTFTPLLDDEELHRLWQGQVFYWVQGRVSYRDTFDRPHYTNFTARLHMPTKTFSFVLKKGYSDGN